MLLLSHTYLELTLYPFHYIISGTIRRSKKEVLIMGVIAAIIGAIGGLCAAMGIVTAAEIILPIGPEFTWMFWFVLSAILLLASIAFSVGRGTSYED